jgi:uncharacterized SAM-binding protein YcdF (DUF218 family)
MKRKRRIRRLLYAILILLIAGVLFRGALPLFGQVLVVSDSLQKSDAIVILASNRIERTYEAAMLYRAGLAPVIVVSNAYDGGESALSERLGVSLPGQIDLQRMALNQLGLGEEAIEELPGRPSSTFQEAELLARLARERRWKRVIVVTSPYHTRRARMYMKRAADGGYEIIVRASRFEPVSPQWWRHPIQRIDVVLEWMKFAFDAVKLRPLGTSSLIGLPPHRAGG